MKQIFLVTCLIMASVLSAQETSEEDIAKTITQVVPPSPNAASLGKYGEYPVNLYNGTANIQIPLWNITIGDLSLPISLSYHSSGVKVNDMPSWVGTGWSLNAGGVITRTMRGLPDEQPFVGNADYPYNYLANAETLCPNGCGGDIYKYSYIDGLVDSEPDIYTYNFVNYTGKFFRSGRTITYPHSNCQIAFDDNMYIVTDPNGTKYYFGKDGSGNNAIEVTNPDLQSPSDVEADPYVSSWYLVKIVSANSNHEINLHYSTHEFVERRIFSETAWINNSPFLSECGNRNPTTTEWTYQIPVLLLDSITTLNSKVTYAYTFNSEYHLLDEIQVFGKDTLEREFVFQYNDFLNQRPFLASITEMNGEDMNLNYEFSYNNPDLLPSVYSKAQDYWGYYNSANSNTTLIPDVPVNGEIHGTFGDRNTDAEKCLFGLLTEITYPTKGKTQFEYEAHQVERNNDLPINYDIQTSQLVVDDATHSCSTFPCTFIKPYTIDFNQEVEFYYNMQYNNQGSDNGCSIELWKINEDSDELIQEITGTTNLIIDYLEKGNYEFRFVREYSGSSIDFELKYYRFDGRFETPNQFIGGARIKSIKNITNEGETQLRQFVYKLGSNVNKSSGVLVSQFPYFQSLSMNWVPINGTGAIIRLCSYTMLSSNNVFLTGLSSGGHVGYSDIYEIFGNYTIDTLKENYSFIDENYKTSFIGENGSIYHQYKVSKDPTTQRYSEVIFDDRNRGHLLEKSIYDNRGIINSKVNNSYQFFEEYTDLGSCQLYSNTQIMGEPVFEPIYYVINPYWKYISESVETSYFTDENNATFDSIFIDKNFDYNPTTLLLKSQKVTKSNGDSIITRYKYPYDYKNAHITQCEDRLNDTSLTKYKPCYLGYLDCLVSNVTEVNTVEELYTYIDSIRNDSLAFNDIVIQTLYHQCNPAYEECNANYDNFNQYTECLSEVQSENDLTDAVLEMRGNNIITPVIESTVYNITKDKLINASLNEYNNFGNYTKLAKTYRKSDQVNENTTFTASHMINNVILIDSAFYDSTLIVDQYDTHGNLIEFHIPNSLYTVVIYAYNFSLPVAKIENATLMEVETALQNLSISLDYINALSLIVDEEDDLLQLFNNLRDELPEAKITSFVYDQLIGVTSITDENKQTIYFIYDDFGRLHMKKDQFGNVIEVINYNYAQEADGR